MVDRIQSFHRNRVSCTKIDFPRHNPARGLFGIVHDIPSNGTRFGRKYIPHMAPRTPMETRDKKSLTKFIRRSFRLVQRGLRRNWAMIFA